MLKKERKKNRYIIFMECKHYSPYCEPKGSITESTNQIVHLSSTDQKQQLENTNNTQT